MSGRVHWYEGLFLQPHHLQVSARFELERAADHLRLLTPYPYGVIESRLSHDALDNMLIRFDRLRVIMPSGLEVDAPRNAELPPLDIKKAYESTGRSFTVNLGVPLWDASRANTVNGSDTGAEAWRVNRLYRTTEVEQPDENTGENPRAIALRMINARLVLDSHDPTGLELLPLIRVGHAAGEMRGTPRQDPQFIPPCFTVSGSPTLYQMIRDLAHQVQASRDDLVVRLSKGGFSIDQMRGIQFEQMLRLRTLNRFAAILGPLAEAPFTTPFQMYLHLRQLLGELAALNPGRDQFQSPGYDHDNPAPAFFDLDRRIRQLLSGAVTQPWWIVEFQKLEHCHLAVLEKKHLTQPNQYFLGVQTRQDPKAVKDLVEEINHFKFMPKSKSQTTGWGVELEEERHPPLGLPSRDDLHYFRLVRDESKPKSKAMWERIVKEQAIAVDWPDMDASDFTLSLYMTVPGGEGGP